MEQSYTLTRADIVEAFRRWSADVVANPGNYKDRVDPEASADCFLSMAGFEVEA